VSAILNALKKLEQETAGTSGHPLQREAKRRRKWRKPTLAGLLVVGLILCGLAGFGVKTLMRKPPASVAPDPSVPSDLSGNGRQAVKMAPPMPVAAPSAPKPFQVKASGKRLAFQGEEKSSPPAREIIAIPLGPEKMPEETSEEAVFAYGTQQWPETAEDLSEETFEETMETPYPMTDETIPEADTPLPDRRIPDRVPDAAPKSVPGIFNDPAVVLQAISWSSDAARRMAVINGKICREGEQVGGYTILKINPEDVTVSRGAVSGRLVFKIR